MADVAPVVAAPQDDEATWSRQYDQQQAIQKSQELTPKAEAPHPFQAVSNWISSLPDRINGTILDQVIPAVDSVYKSPLGRADRDIVTGAAKGVTNVADAAYSFARSASVSFHDDPAMRMITGEKAPPTPGESQIWTHAKASVQDFTDAVKVKDPGIADDLIQYAAQVAPSYLLAGKLLGGLHGVANAVASGIPADAAALDPHAPRFADILSVLKQTDGKIGQALRAAGPYGLNAYINYLGSNGNETEAQGRFKNALDGILPNFIGTELLHAAGITVKQGYAGMRYMVANGVGSGSELATMGAQRGGPAAARQSATDPGEEIAAEQARKDMAAAAANPNGKRPPLVQTGEDPAQDILDQQVRSDMAASSLLDSDKPSSLEDDKVLHSARTLAQTQSDTGGVGSTHALVTSLAAHMDGSTDDGAFYKEVFNRLSGKQLDTKIVPPGTSRHPAQDAALPGQMGQHKTASDTTALYEKAFRSNANFAHTLAHESVHAATLKALAAKPDVREALSQIAQEAAVNDNALASPDKYGLKNSSDFVAEAESNPRFQQFLKNSKDAEGRPLWDKYKEVIGGIFGFSSAVMASPMFDKLLTREKSDD